MKEARRQCPRSRALPLAFAAACCALACGCEKELEIDYGQVSHGSESINGLDALAHWLENDGRQVRARGFLSKSVGEEADCIIWAPDDFEAPSPAAVAWFNDWLDGDKSRTLIYIGRDYECQADYWQTLADRATGPEKTAYAAAAAAAAQEFQTARPTTLLRPNCNWFSIDNSRPRRRVRQLTGEPDWTAGVQTAGINIELGQAYRPPANADRLLGGPRDPILFRHQPNAFSGPVLVVTNGAFLLNGGLVNPEHRVLAQRLIEEIGPRGQRVTFLESGPGGPPIFDGAPQARSPSSLQMLSVPPLDKLLLHLMIFGLLYVFARLPIFGRPRFGESQTRLETESGLIRVSSSRADFGPHAAAIGKLLERTGEADFARQRLQHYRTVVRGESSGGG